MALFEEYREHNKNVNEKLKIEITNLGNKLSFIDKNPKDTLEEVLKIEEFKNIVKTLSEIKRPGFKDIIKITLPFSIIITLVYSVFRFIKTFIEYHNAMIGLNSSLSGIIIFIIMFVLSNLILLLVSNFLTIMTDTEELYPIFMKGIFPKDYKLNNKIKSKNEYTNEIVSDSKCFYKYDRMFIDSLLSFENDKNIGYISDIDLEKRHKDKDGKVSYTTVFKGFLGAIKFKEKKNYFEESGGFIITNKRIELFSDRINDFFNSDELNKKLNIYSLNENKTDFKIKQFLTPETEELIKALLDQFNRIGIKISNDGILLLLNHEQKSLLGDNSFNIDDFQYKNLYTEYKKAYCLQIIFNRLKRNMTGEIDLEKEKEMNHWIYDINKDISNNEWDNWIKNIKQKEKK